MIKTVLFDLDGTLVDTLRDLAETGERVLSEYGLGNPDGSPVYAVSQYRYFVGKGIRRLVETITAGKLSPEQTDSAYHRFLELYEIHCLDYVKPYSGIMEMLEELQRRGIPFGVLTNKPQPQAERIVDRFFSEFPPVCVVGGKEGRARKPDPSVTAEALQLCNATAQTTLYVGDSDVDVQTAHAAGLCCAGAVWGFRGEEELTEAGTDHLLTEPEDLFPLFA